MLASDKIVSTTCPYCGVGCNLHLHIADNFIHRVTSPFDGVVNHGNLCVKGRFGHDFLYHPDRIGNYELPDEMHEYARVMLVRINLAYEQIG